MNRKGWVLDPKVLVTLLRNMETVGNLLPVNRADGIVEFNAVFKSALVEGIYYRVNLLERNRGGQNLQIHICSSTAPDGVLVYNNGVIVRAGGWIAELIETLPSTIAKMTVAASDKLEELSAEDSDRVAAEYNLMNEQLLDELMDRPAFDHDVLNLGGMPVYFL